MIGRGLAFFKRNWQNISIFFIIFILTTVTISIIFPTAKPLLTSGKQNTNIFSNDTLYITAIGDSLTEGIGDTSGLGGYIPYLTKELKYIYGFGNVDIINYGKSGNRTVQITDRIKNTLEIQNSIESSDIIVITTGANDLFKLIEDNIFNSLNSDIVEDAAQDYTVNLSLLYNTIRKYNADCPIYYLGIYNPYYLNFPVLTEMQDIIDLWNETTKDFTQSQDKSYFIPINDQIYMGNGISSDSTTKNNLLCEEDSFHPNNIGYQIIAKEFQDKIQNTQDDWLEKQNKTIYITAIGDSLTKGLGDSTGLGGYVPYLSNNLKNNYGFDNVNIINYGKSGNRTTQIADRIQDTVEIQNSIESADLIVLTAGANDLLKVVKNNLFDNLNIEIVEDATQDYKANLALLYNTIRKYNTNCPIYHLGIYNPYYLNFPELTQMQDIINLWNNTTKEFTESQYKYYFIPINDKIYMGSSVNTDSNSDNKYMSEENTFHPNNIGYQIIAKAFRDKIQDTEDAWLKGK